MDPLFISAIVLLGVMGFVFGAIIAVVARRFAVKIDPRVKHIMDALPGANCGACGYPGCSGLAEAIAKGEAPVDACIPGGKEVADRIAEIMEAEVGEHIRMVAIAKCFGGCESAYDKMEYHGETDCRIAYLTSGGPKGCQYGCLGFGTCAEECPFGAITMVDELPVVDDKTCTGCGVCVNVCPVDVMELIPYNSKVYVACNNKDRGVSVKKFCKTGCIACRLCEKFCPYDAIHITDNLAKVDYSRCTNCGICVAKCPTKCILDKIETRPKVYITGDCTGCGECKRVCSVKAITGEEGEQYKVDMDRCIGCGECIKVCPASAIRIIGSPAEVAS